ncbi:hypothetical protein Ancab_000738 [Ancistrocladus abbreviatus]
MLGPQWSKKELGCFYEAYRKYGEDWKKIAIIVRDRSPEMVEALYNMNRAYLSLPEGTASVVGLIAMMTDHYNVMEATGSDRDSDDCIAVRPLKYLKGSVQVGLSEEDRLQPTSGTSSGSLLSLLKRQNDGTHLLIPTKKRTPRYPVPSLDKDYILSYVPPNKKAQKSELSLGDDNVAQGAAMVLTEARQRLLQLPKMLENHSGAGMDKERVEGGLLSTGAKYGGGFMEMDSWRETDKYAIVARRRGGGEKVVVEDAEIKRFGDIGEEDNGVNRACGMSFPRKKLGYEATNAESLRSAAQAQRKRNKKLNFEDDRSDFDALQTLVDLSLMMPSTAEPVESSRESVIGRDVIVDSTTRSGHSKLRNANAIREYKTKCRSLDPKKAKVQIDCHSRKSAKDKATTVEKTGSAVGSRQDAEVCSCFKECKSVRSPDVSSSNAQQAAEAVVAVSGTSVETTQVLPKRGKGRCNLDRSSINKRPQSNFKDQTNKNLPLLHENAPSSKDKLSHCLSLNMVRRWCIYEWFYSAIDYPWFAKMEFVEYLNHVGLGHAQRLTRVEWGVIRSSLGRPRRFSECFLHEEREKLKQYRELVRMHYSELRAGLREGLPTDLAPSLSVGQRVIAIHPRTKEFHDGSIVTVDHDECKVQFDQPNLGVEIIKDIDCMPLNPSANVPEALRRENISLDMAKLKEPTVGALKSSPINHTQHMDAHLAFPPFSHSIINQAKKTGKKNLSVEVYARDTSLNARVLASESFQTSSATQNLPSGVVQFQLREGDVCPFSELTSALNGEILYSQPVLNQYDPGFNLTGILKSARDKAHGMVDTAIKVISIAKKGEDAFSRIGEALDAAITWESSAKFGMTSRDSANCNLSSCNQMTSGTSEHELKGDASDQKSIGGTERKDHQFPSELISSCVATLFMIQSCTERQYSPAEVAQILDTAVRSLQPCYPGNAPIYRDIELCMGRIKTQILALVPS